MVRFRVSLKNDIEGYDPSVYHNYYIKHNKLYLKKYGESSDIYVGDVPKDVNLRALTIKKVFVKIDKADAIVTVNSL